MSPHIRHYLLSGIAGLPTILHHLVRGQDPNSPIWDFRPDPERFTLREILAHMSDFDEVWLYRFGRMVAEDGPDLPNWDEAAAVIEKNYAAADPVLTQERLAASRAKLCAWLGERAEADWERGATRPQVGAFTIQDAAVLILAHDAYHIQQISNWLELSQ
jgi:uncharacterized damage-inducible protein DinB